MHRMLATKATSSWVLSSLLFLFGCTTTQHDAAPPTGSQAALPPSTPSDAQVASPPEEGASKRHSVSETDVAQQLKQHLAALNASFEKSRSPQTMGSSASTNIGAVKSSDDKATLACSGT